MLSENISLRAKPVLRSRGDIETLDFSLMDLLHPRRGNAEDFVQDVFFNAYRARLDAFYPLLVSIAYPDGEYAAVALQARYRYSRELEPAVELYTGQDTRGLGPVIMGSWPLGGARQLRWEGGVIFGLDSDTPDQTFRALLEYEF